MSVLRKEMEKYRDIDEDELLKKLSEEELQRLEDELEELDPDVSLGLGLCQRRVLGPLMPLSPCDVQNIQYSLINVRYEGFVCTKVAHICGRMQMLTLVSNVCRSIDGGVQPGTSRSALDSVDLPTFF